MNKTIFQDDKANAIRISSLKKFEGDLIFSGFAAKFVVAGKESYYIKDRKYDINQGQYILGNSETISTIKIDSKEDVKGLCIDVSPAIIQEVATYHLSNVESIQDFLLGDQFLVNSYNAKHTYLGYALSEINKHIHQPHSNSSILNTELFYSIAESIITDQSTVFSQYDKLSFKKRDTNEQIMRQLLSIKDYIDEHLFDDLTIDDLARVSLISKYHLIRLFKTSFKLSPYQYILKRKLQKAKELLQSGKRIQDVIHLTGFADAPSFSKAFKGAFGITPSAFQLRNAS